MNSDGFFQEIQHTPVEWEGKKLFLPAFYQDLRYMLLTIMAPIDKLKAVLPSDRLNPYRITPWHSVLSISALEYRECDINPYNEISIGIPVTLDRQTPMFTGTFRGMPEITGLYIHHLPVTTEIALELGIGLLGMPKFLAQIDFTEEDGWVTCKMQAEDRHILTLGGRKLTGKDTERRRFHLFSSMRGYLLRCDLIFSEREMGETKRGADVQFELGDHRVADELRGLSLGKVLNYEYCHQAQAILTPVLESHTESR